jgi:cytosine permease
MRSAEAGEPAAERAGDARIGALRIVLILLALMIALPAFVTGAELAHAMGARQAALASLGGGLLLAMVAALGGAAGARHRASTYELIVDAFGHQGGRVANGVLGITVIGWYGVVAMMFGDALASALPGIATLVPGWLLVLAGCVVTTLTAMLGFRALDWLSALTTPLKLGLLLWAFSAALKGGFGPTLAYLPAQALPLGTGISMVAGGLIVGASLSPDICRFARTPQRAAWGCALAYGLGFPAVLMLAGLPSIATGERDVVKIMLALGLGLPAMLTVVLAAWSNNSFNLYAATLVGSTLRPATPPWRLALAAGLCGTAMGLAGISQLLVPYLIWLSILIPPVAGVYLAHAWLRPRQDGPSAPAWRGAAFVAWALGSGWAMLPAGWGWSLTPVPAVDALLVSAVASVVAGRYRPSRLRPA